MITNVSLCLHHQPKMAAVWPTHGHPVLFHPSRGWLAADKPCWHRWFAWQYGKGPQPKTREPVEWGTPDGFDSIEVSPFLPQVVLWSLRLVVKFENEISRHKRICESLPKKFYSCLLSHKKLSTLRVSWDHFQHTTWEHDDDQRSFSSSPPAPPSSLLSNCRTNFRCYFCSTSFFWGKQTWHSNSTEFYNYKFTRFYKYIIYRLHNYISSIFEDVWIN